MNGTAVRIIPCLDLRRGRVVKGVRFGGLEDSGDPAELAARYEAEGADEIAMLDISATLEARATTLDAVRAVRKSVGIPILAGGGIRSVADAGRLLDSGADRVSVNSAAVADPGLIDILAARFGIQCVVLAIDAHACGRGRGGPERGYRLATHSGGHDTGIDPVAWAATGAARGAGEILLTSIDRDGTGQGYDLELLERVAEACRIPVIASGGAATCGQFLEGALAGARALLAAGVFHRRELAISTLKEFLSTNGVEVRI
ncbi:MAG: HisA/HisF-related TIM barrel protein [Rectinemataceae bacterium]